MEAGLQIWHNHWIEQSEWFSVQHSYMSICRSRGVYPARDWLLQVLYSVSSKRAHVLVARPLIFTPASISLFGTSKLMCRSCLALALQAIWCFGIFHFVSAYILQYMSCSSYTCSLNIDELTSSVSSAYAFRAILDTYLCIGEKETFLGGGFSILSTKRLRVISHLTSESTWGSSEHEKWYFLGRRLSMSNGSHQTFAPCQGNWIISNNNEWKRRLTR